MSSISPQQRKSTDPRPRRLSPQASVLIAALAALVALAVGRWVPLPPLVTGEETVKQQLVDTRGKVVAQRYLYLEAQREFEHYLRTVPLPNIPQELHAIATDLRNGGDRATLLRQAHERVATATDFGQTLSRYAHPADDLFTLLRQYDDQLMAYSRTLGARSEELRRGTWPILSWLQRYPPPVGDRPDIHFFPATEVDRDVAALQAAAQDMDSAPDTADVVERAATAADPIWDAGLMVPTIAWFHDGYYGSLRNYDAQMLEAAAAPDQPLPASRALVAGAVTLGMLGLMLLALLLLFLPTRLPWRLARHATPS